MKRLFVIVSFCMTLCSCDPSVSTEYVIENKTDKNLELIEYSRDSLGIKSQITKIFANNSYVEMYDCCLGKGILGYIDI